MHKIPNGYQGMKKCKLSANSFVYWPDLHTNFEIMLAPYCARKKFQTSQRMEPMMSSEVPPMRKCLLQAIYFS